jgi:hypothetical protein
MQFDLIFYYVKFIQKFLVILDFDEIIEQAIPSLIVGDS